MSTLGKQFIKGLLWSSSGRLGYLTISLVTNIILANLLTPYEFGLVGIVMFFIIISKVLTESGLSGALIRKENATDLDFSTIFIFNLIVSLVLMVLLITAAGPIANTYDEPIIKNVLIALSTVLLISAFQFTQKAKLTKALKFKEQATYELIAVICGSIVGITMAYQAFGVWSLVAMQIVTATALSAMYLLNEEKIGKLRFSIKSFKGLYRFGMYTTLASLLNTVFDNIYNLILGKFFTVHSTGLFYQAKKLQEIPVGIINSQTQGVVFSTLSKLQNDKVAFDNFYRRITSAFTMLTGLVCLLLVLYAHEAIFILYGESWLDAAYYMKILAVAGFFYMQEMLNRVLFKIFDRTEKILQLEIIKKAIQSISIIVGIAYLSLDILMYGFLATAFVSYFLNYTVSRKVYGGFDWFEIITVLKVFVAATITFLISFVIFKNSDLSIAWTISLSPLVTALYITLLLIMKTGGVINEIKWLLRLGR